MTNLRQEARGENCEIRSPVCNFDPLTTVLAHYRLIGISGMGQKSPDLIAAHACSDCHDLVDGRRHIEGYVRKDVQLLHLQGVVRTQAKLIGRGLIGDQHVEGIPRLVERSSAKAPAPALRAEGSGAVGAARVGPETAAGDTP